MLKFYMKSLPMSRKKSIAIISKKRLTRFWRYVIMRSMFTKTEVSMTTKTILEVPYRENGMNHFLVMAYDDDADIDERVLNRVGTISFYDGVSIGQILDAADRHFKA